MIETAIPPFQVLLDEHRETVYRYLIARVGRTDADDCFQETFLSALRAYPRLESADNLRAWLLRIAERKAIDRHRSRARVTTVAQVPEDPTRSDGYDYHGLWEAVRTLPAKQQAAIICRYLNDMPYAEVGRLVGCSEEAARQNVRAGLKKLREVWER